MQCASENSTVARRRGNAPSNDPYQKFSKFQRFRILTHHSNHCVISLSKMTVELGIPKVSGRQWSPRSALSLVYSQNIVLLLEWELVFSQEQSCSKLSQFLNSYMPFANQIDLSNLSTKVIHEIYRNQTTYTELEIVINILNLKLWSCSRMPSLQLHIFYWWGRQTA